MYVLYVMILLCGVCLGWSSGAFYLLRMFGVTFLGCATYLPTYFEATPFSVLLYGNANPFYVLCYQVLTVLVYMGLFVTDVMLIIRIMYRLFRYGRKRKKKRKSRKKIFHRRKLPYWLVIRCRRRKGNRPSRIYGPTRREQLLTRREKRRRYRHGRNLRVWRGLYNESTNTLSELIGLSRAKFQLDELPTAMIDEFVKSLGPGGIQQDIKTFDLSTPEQIERGLPNLVLRAHYVGGRYVQSMGYLNAMSVSECPLIFDTGASNGLTPYKSDFIPSTYREMDLPVKTVASNGSIVGGGFILRKYKTRSGSIVYVKSFDYHMPSAEVRLTSPQSLIKSMKGGRAVIDAIRDNVEWHLPDGEILDIPIDPATNLPTFPQGFVCTNEEKRMFVEEHPEMLTAEVLDKCAEEVECEDPSMSLSEIPARDLQCFTCVADETNQNLTPPQKELLHWHWKLGVNMRDLQHMMKTQNVYDQDDRLVSANPPIIPTKYKGTAKLKPEDFPFCLACKLAAAKSRGTETTTTTVRKEREGILTRDKYEPGEFISSDQFVVHTAGRKAKGYGREGPHNCYHGGTIYQDAASRLVKVQNQVSLGASETVMGKAAFEDWIWNLAGALAKHYHSDNGIFQADLFKADCKEKKQTQSYSGVGAKHQNAHAERTIQTISYWARTFMVHAALHWPSDGADSVRLWAFAVQHAAWLYNRLPNKHLNWKSPLEVFTKTKSDHRDLLRSHVWGCPAFVLEAKLQDGQKLPKFDRRARMGQFLGFSDEHSSMVGLVRNLRTNHISPQFHVVYDDLFTTIQNDTRRPDDAIERIFTDLFENCRDYYGEEAIETVSVEESGQTDESPELNDEWLTEPERRDKKARMEAKRSNDGIIARKQAEEFEKLNSEYNPSYPSQPTYSPTNEPVPDGALISDDDYSDDDSVCSCGSEPLFESSGGDVDPEGATPPPPSPAGPGSRTRSQQGSRGRNNLDRDGSSPPQARRSQRSRGRYNTKTAGLEQHPEFNRAYTSLVTDRMRDEDYIKSNRERFYCTLGKKQPPRSARPSRKKREYKARLFSKKLKEANDTAGAMDWNVPSVDALLHSDLARFVHFAASDCGYDGSVESLAVNWLHPLMLAAKSSTNQLDNPNWMQAMNGPFASEYWEAACIEIETLERMEAWDVVERTDDMKVLPSTWAFKCKRFPDGLIKKFKARFCARGDFQKHGIDYWETYAPVVQWITVRLLLILECLLGLVSKQGDVSCAFLHAHLPEGDEVYLHMPQGFIQYGKNRRPKVLKCKRSIYGLKQSPREFWKYMVQKLESAGLRQSELDPCLFIGDTVIAILYVDDVLMWSTDADHIYALGQDLRSKGVELEEEGDAAGFLGVKLTRIEETGQILMTQEGLITRIIEALGLDENSTSRPTPCHKTPLTKDLDGDPATGNFSYASVVGMLLYLAGHTRPDLAYSVNSAARFTFAPRNSHEQAVKAIGRYLLKTRDKGLVLTPTKELNIQAFPDADFAGLYSYEDNRDPISVRSRTGFVITVANCPVLWQSKLQTETATSTMEAEIVALASCCRELFPIIDMVNEIGDAVGLQQSERAKMHIKIHEDNSGALVLAQTIPPQFTPRSKHYAIKTHWFREQIIKRGIELLKIATADQLGDICTKCLPRAQFEYLRKKLMGW